MIQAVDHFKPYRCHNKFILRTDHEVLIYLTKNRHSKSRLLRWAIVPQGYDFNLEHVKVTNNPSYLLSRAFTSNLITITQKEKDLIIPVYEDRIKILNEYHLLTGHGGLDAMKYLIIRKYWWKEINKEITNLAKSYLICQKNSILQIEITCTPIKSKEIN